MKQKIKKGLSGALAVIIGAASVQGSIIYAAAEDLIKDLTADIGSGDVNNDKSVDSSDLNAMYDLLGSSAGKITSYGNGAFDVYKDSSIDVRDLMAVKMLSEGKTPQKPENESSGKSVKLEVTDAECCPGEQVKIDVKIVDWAQDINAVELYMDFDSNLSLADITCTGDYQYAVNGNELKIYGFTSLADVYRGNIATLTFDVPDTAYGDYDVKVTNCAFYNSSFQTYNASTEVGLIAADVTERPLYLTPSYVNSQSLRLSWSMPYCSGDLEGFIVYRDNEEIARTSEPWYYDEGLEKGKKYVYSVQAYGADNYLSAKSKNATGMPQEPVISAVTFPDNASVIGGKNTYVKCSLEKTVDAEEYSLTYVDQQGETQTIFRGSQLAFSAVDIKWNIKDIPSGDYDLTFSVKDKDGAVSEKTVSVTVDTTPPEQVFGFDVFEGEEETQLTWGIAAEAKVVGYNIYRRSESGSYTLLAYVDGRENLEYIDKDLNEGDVYFYMMCSVDKYGQEGIYSDEKSAAAKGDETQPEVTLFLPESGNVLNRFVNISVKADDNVGVASIATMLSLDDGETWSEVFKSKGSSVNYSFDTTPYQNQKIKLKAVAYDYAGNISNDLVHLYVIDNCGPEKVENINSVAVTDVTATISWNDVPDDDFSYFVVKYNKTDDKENVKSVNVHTTLGVNLTGLEPDSEYSVRVAAVDIYGNVGEYSDEFIFNTASDEIAPVIMSVKPAPGYYNSSIPLSIAAQDDFNTSAITIQTAVSADDDAEWINAAVIKNSVNSSNFTASYDLSLDSFNDGTIYIRAFAEDLSGNIGETSAVYEYIVDKTAPAAPEKFNVSSDANAILLTWEAYSDKIDSACFSLYRSTEEDGEYTKILDKSNVLNYYDRDADTDTEYFYKLTAIDAAGNESEMSKAVSAKLEEDTVAPEIVSVSPEDGSTLSSVHNKISVLVSDNVKLDSVKMEYRLSEDAEYKVFSNQAGIGNYYTVAEGTLPSAALSGDSVQVRISATDAAGLSAETKEVTYSVNNIKTVISEVNAQQLDEYTSVTWTAEENELSVGYYIYKKVNTGGWQKMTSVAVDPENNGKYEYKDYYNTTAGTVTYKTEAYSENGIKTEKLSKSIQIYTNPEASLDCEVTQQQNVEYVYDATGCKDYYGITDVSIDFGDGNAASESSAADAKFVHKYTKTGKYKVVVTCTNEQGLVSSAEQIVEVIERTLIGESVITVNTTEGKPASGIFVYVDLGSDLQKRYKTDAAGRVTIKTSAGIHSIGVYGDGFLPADRECTVLAGSGNKFDFTVVNEDIVTADFTVERMTLDEIKAVGIDINAPENQHIVEVSIDVSYKVHEAPASSLKYYVNGSGAVVGGSGWVSGGGSGGGFGGGSGSGSITKPVYISVDPETNKVDTVITLTVPISASFLKEFFHAKLTIYNNADEKYTISDNQVSLNLPDGLSLVKTESTCDKDVAFDVIEGQSSKEIDWIIRGDKEGVYDISASYHGTLDKFNEEINETFMPDEPITVYGEAAVSVDINVPETLVNNQFVFDVAMTNNSPVDVYCPSTNVGAVISSAFGAKNSATPVIYQRRLMKDGKYVRIIPANENFDTLEPGYTFSVVYKTPHVFAGITDEGGNSFYSSRLEVINASMKLLNDSKIPVHLNIIDMVDAIIFDEIKTIPNYDPETQCVIMATSTRGSYLNGVTIKLGNQTGTTNSSGYAVFDLPDGPVNLTASLSGYKTTSINSYTGYTSGLDMIRLAPDTPPAPTRPPTASSGGNKTPVDTPLDETEEKEDEATGETVKKYVGSISLNDGISLSMGEDFPVLDNFDFSIDGIKLPVGLEVNDKGEAALYIGNFDMVDRNFEYNSNLKTWEEILYDPDDYDDAGNKKSEFQKKLEQVSKFINDYKGMANFKNETVGKNVDKFFSHGPASKELGLDYSVAGVLSGTFPFGEGIETCAKNGIEVNGYIVFSFKASYSISKQCFFSIPPVVIPVTAEIEFSNDAKVSAGITIVYKDSQFTSSGNLKLENKTEVTPFIGVGVSGIAAAGIYGNLTLTIEATLLSTIKSKCGLDKVLLGFDIGFQAYLGPFKYKKSFLSGAEPLKIYERDDDSGNKNAVSRFDPNSLYDTGSYAVNTDIVKASWLGSEKTASDISGYSEFNYIEKNSAGVTSQTIASAGNDLVMLYLVNDTNRDAINAQKLVYSVFNKDSQTWSEPVQLDSDQTADYAPALYSDGSKIYAVYQNTASVLSSDSELSDWTKAQNIAVAVFDSDSKTFGAPVSITSDSDVFDSNPSIASANGNIFAVWVSNENSDFFGTNETNSIMYSQLGENGWSEPEMVLGNLNAVTDISAGEINGELCISYITDNDNDLSTADDRSLNVKKYSELQSYEISHGVLASPVFAMAGNDTANCLYWYANGNIVRSENLNETSNLISDGTIALNNGFAVTKNRILWSGSENGKSSNLYESVYNTDSDSWSNPVKLSAQDDYIENVTAAVLDGKIYAVMNRNDVTLDPDTVESVNSIVWTTVESAENISITSVSYNHVGYKTGKELPVTVLVENNGESYVDNVTLTIKDADGKVIKTMNSKLGLAPGYVGFISATVKPNTKTVPKYTFSISTTDITDGNLSDNSAELDASFSNMNLTAESNSANTVKITVTNNGNITDNTVVTLKNYKSNTVITSFTLKNIAPGKSISKQINLSDYTNFKESEIRISAGSNSDIDNADNLVYVLVEKKSQSNNNKPEPKPTEPNKPDTPNNDSYKLGDVNEDGNIDALDASNVLLEYALKATNQPLKFNELQSKAADVNKDGSINALDASLILAYYAAIATGNKASF